MDQSQTPVDRIQRFAEKRQKAEDEYQQQPLSSNAFQTYNRKLDDTLKELQDRVKRQEDDLQKLRMNNSIDLSKAGTDPLFRVSQVRRAKKAYDSLLKSGNQLPKPGSPLPSLLALEETSRLVKESKISVSMTGERLSINRQRVKAEEANLHDAQLITSGLRERIERLRNESSQKEEKSPEKLARELVGQQQEKNEELEKATEDLKASLHKFIDEHLASMLAAEDRGGPTVGDVLHVSDATLEAGYTNHGKPKKVKSVSSENNGSNQQRIDELIRRKTARDENQTTNPSNKREAAAAQMHTLLDSLLEAGSSYIDLPRDSAASRFLVRAKVAKFHPRDARRLRLIDFGRSLDD
ncbi:hypothetical protein ASPWEDRAFT_177253 [Aspergillus wentii DTO 134E9]|uniref:Uncharacterized protein n=1 Tax=Aspergillus wentii DTO 134E9 TaxID=1073089 RepID=A0A1L9R6R0_ASPWE|nr:uncharacterized protein ASPWEDRAFT_177253 [Aspergillus wentii DTO 134E9]KAI9926736.1 hypothetical protein MW887_003830 [Aspergillus wentii]OJJ30600.1 hypothetical protein ASPWEDRAFT_177253 [Aspergillus wentii DTO 134E9]